MTFVAGQRLRASQLAQVGVLVGRNQRTTNSTLGSTIARVLSTSAPIVSGRSYRVVASGEIYSDAGIATTQNELRFTTNGDEPLTTSTVMGRTIVRHDSTGAIPDGAHILAYYHSSTTGTLKVALCIQRVAGAVNVAWTADATFPTTLTIEDVGPTVTSTGTVY